MSDKIKLGPDWNTRVKARIAAEQQADIQLREDLKLAVEAAPGIVVKLPYMLDRDRTPNLSEAASVIDRMDTKAVIAVLLQLIEVREM